MVRFAILGAGRIGTIHAINVAADPRARLVVVADPVKRAGEALAAQLGCDTTLDCAAAIAREDVDAVVIGTPSDTHFDLMLTAVRLGKPVLCEKPIGLDIHRARVVIKELEVHRGRVMLAFNRRYDPDNMRIRGAIDAGEVGDVRQVFLTSRDSSLAPREYLKQSGGIFRDMTIHDFDMARWLLGEEPTDVTAIASRLVDPHLDELRDFDSVMVLLRTKSGKQCHINGCREAIYGFDQRIEVFGSKGMVMNQNHRSTTVRRWSATATDAAQPLLTYFQERHADSYRIELDAFLDALENERAMPSTPLDGLKALHLANCAYEAATTGRLVKV